MEGQQVVERHEAQGWPYFEKREVMTWNRAAQQRHGEPFGLVHSLLQKAALS